MILRGHWSLNRPTIAAMPLFQCPTVSARALRSRFSQKWISLLTDSRTPCSLGVVQHTNHREVTTDELATPPADGSLAY